MGLPLPPVPQRAQPLPQLEVVRADWALGLLQVNSVTL